MNNALLFCLFFDKNRSHERRFFLVGALFWAPPFVVFANQHASQLERVRGLDLACSWIDPDSVQLARLACLNPHASLIDARIEPWCRHGATVRSAAPRLICEAKRRGYDKTGVCLDYRHTGRLRAAFLRGARVVCRNVFSGLGLSLYNAPHYDWHAAEPRLLRAIARRRQIVSRYIITCI